MTAQPRTSTHDGSSPTDPPTGPSHETADLDRPDEAHQVPDGVDDATVVAVGKLTAALEVVEQARGMLYGFHRMTGRADNDLVEALEALEEAGHGDLAAGMRAEIFGRNVLAKRWTFQVVEDYDDHYWAPFRDWERTTRERLMAGRRHVYEAQLKERNRTHGRPRHEARPVAE